MQTIPSTAQMALLSEATPIHMVPNEMPYAVVIPGYLSHDQCDRILELGETISPHNFHGCNAETRDFERPLDQSLDPLLTILLAVNSGVFHFDLYENEPAAYLQTYGTGNDYRWHVDGAPGQSRKLTAVAMMTDRNDYFGGNLVFQVSQKQIAAPADRGTVIVFPAWVNHCVTAIDSGRRQTVNMGLWGPPFK